MQPRAVVAGKRILGKTNRVALESPQLRIVSGRRASQTEAKWTKLFKPEERILVPAGRVLLGDPQGDADEQPNRWVEVTKPFFLSRSLVSVEQIKVFLAAGSELQGARFFRESGEEHVMDVLSGEAECDFRRRALELIPNAMGELPDYESNKDKDNPPCGVFWALARGFCQWVGGDLPTPVQWRRAARGENGQAEFGNPIETAVIFDNQTEDYRGVRKVRGEHDKGRAGWLGLRDLSGNLWEWTNGRYDANWHSRIEDGEADPHLPLTDLSSQTVEIAGGSWYDDRGCARAANRDNGFPERSYVLLGFRVAWPQD